MSAPSDQAHRDRALDPGRSFIVQAPAGSGKTELLIQRYLRLLACVDQPEEVLVVTFTRKAAAELRDRVIAAIRLAEDGQEPADPNLRRSRALALEILGDEHRRGWQLHRHPARLAVSTIDSVNAWLAGRAPLSAGRSALHAVTEAPEGLYREAARATLELLAEGNEAGRNVARVLQHLDNDAARFEELILAMLPRRDQWLRHVARTDDEREAMESSLRALTEHGLREAGALIDPALREELTLLLRSAGRHLRDAHSSSPVRLWSERADFPAAIAIELQVWQGLAEALLTRSDSWRKKVSSETGFPPKTAEKARMERLLEACAGREELRARLAELRILPGAAYADRQWGILHALLDVLRHAAAELTLVFARHGATDFAEIAADALNALGEDVAPSELGLALDCRIRHILVDEFQDTSLSQFDLLLQLTAGWEPGDGRTIFLVGDPMQSIYRFRQAEVGLFMRVRADGIGDLKPEPLQLTANFRSAPGLVTWVNRTFSRTFPRADDPVLGAAGFCESVPARPAVEGDAGGVRLHWLPDSDVLEAARVVEIVRRRRNEDGRDVCILVRSRAHAVRVIGALREARIPFVAPELESMERASVAQDLLALTRALIHPGDRLAWIGLLRAPWCGLSLADLNLLAGMQQGGTIAEAVRTSGLHEKLSAPGACSVRRLAAVLERAEAARGRRPLRDLVEGAWLELGGPATTREDGELETAETFLALLETVDAGGDCPDPVWLGQQMTQRRGSLGSGSAGVQVMTMHKAKGLEFDTVILPGLASKVGTNEPPLLLWHEAPGGRHGEAPVLAPLAPAGTGGDRLYDYLAQVEGRKQAFETDRLTYVACTRARNGLHLLMRIATKSGGLAGEIAVRKPLSGSVLERLWPVLAEEAREAATRLQAPAAVRGEDSAWTQPLVRRLPDGWRLPPAPPAFRLRGAGKVAGAEALQFEWAGNWTRHVGSVVHHWLRFITEEGPERFDAGRLRELEPEFRRMLEQLGAETGDLPKAVTRVTEALCATLADPKGRWIMSAAHAQAHSELPLTVADGELFREIIVDRTFVAADGCRWVIDYKTSTHEGGDPEAFLRDEADRYREQLRQYRGALAALGSEPIRTALYYPLLSRFHEVVVDEDPGGGLEGAR